MRHNSLWSGALLSGASLAAFFAMPAAAQEVSDEIVVTATKREQAIQDVPIAVSAFTDAQLLNQGIEGRTRPERPERHLLEDQFYHLQLPDPRRGL